MGFGSVRLLLAVFIGLVVLYYVTRDQWNWTKLARGAVVVLAILLGVGGGWVYWSSLPPTSPVSEFWGISLGASKSDVRFLKGEPTGIVEPNGWIYDTASSSTYFLAFDDADEATRIVVAPGFGYSSGVSLLGVRPGFDVERLIERLGEPSRVTPLGDDLRRVYLYAHLNAVFVLQQGEVVSFGIYDVDAGDPYAEGGDEVGPTSSR